MRSRSVLILLHRIPALAMPRKKGPSDGEFSSAISRFLPDVDDEASEDDAVKRSDDSAKAKEQDRKIVLNRDRTDTPSSDHASASTEENTTEEDAAEEDAAEEDATGERAPMQNTPMEEPPPRQEEAAGKARGQQKAGSHGMTVEAGSPSGAQPDTAQPDGKEPEEGSTERTKVRLTAPYVDEAVNHIFEETWLQLRRMTEEKVSQSEVIEAALVIACEEFKQEGGESALYQAIESIRDRR